MNLLLEQTGEVLQKAIRHFDYVLSKEKFTIRDFVNALTGRKKYDAAERFINQCAHSDLVDSLLRDLGYAKQKGCSIDEIYAQNWG